MVEATFLSDSPLNRMLGVSYYDTGMSPLPYTNNILLFDTISAWGRILPLYLLYSIYLFHKSYNIKSFSTSKF
jgi:hypothetical protein